MANSFNPLNPMNHSCYTEFEYPGTIEEVVRYYDNMPAANPNGPKLRPQVTKDSWYYSKDKADDGHISPFEKLKAFVKGGTYNMVKGLFCDKDGFSLSRTLTTAAVGTAIYLTGPIGVAVAGGFGLLAALDNFNQSAKLAKNAATDQEAREAYEGFGESTSTAGLSLFGGFKGINAIKNNFAWIKANPHMKVNFFDNFLKWDVSKYATLRPTKQPEVKKPPVTEEPIVEPPIQEKPPVTEEPVVEPPIQEKPPVTEEPVVEPPVIEESPIIERPPVTEPQYFNPPEISRGGAGSPIPFEGEYFPNTTPTQVYPHTGVNAKPVSAEYFSETTPTGNITSTKSGTPKIEPEYFSETNPTGYKPDINPTNQQPQYFSESNPIGEINPKSNPDIEWYGF